ncbi:MAG TPA: VIT1/CCC1 transporter family protein [Blastocatellia bacterium]|nr:VIT1/CCC1 transporter family protein [Blastocatellia bacterium]
MEHEHSPEAIKARLSAGPRHSYLRDWIYGGIDGSVTTFAVVAGVVGAQLSPGVILVIGMANIIADGFSMAASNFLATRTEKEELKRVEAVENRHIDRFPEGEREEVRQIFYAKGFEGEELERVVELITADRERWIRTMLTEEYGLPQEVRSAWMAALSTFSAFCICGLIPLLPFLLGLPSAFTLATFFTGGVFFVIGAVKSLWSNASWWRSGLGTLALGGTAAGLAYAAGVLLQGLA